MNEGRIYTATFAPTAIGTAAQSIMELQVPANTIIQVMRAWLSPAVTATPLNEVVAIALYGNDAVATAGTAMVEQALTPIGAQNASDVVALLEPTIAATPLDLYQDAYHLQNGWLWTPIPEEMGTFIGGNADPGDNVGIRLTTTSSQAFTICGGMTWAEISSA